jgi:hypothetical protein
MPRIKNFFKYLIKGLPIAAIIGASFLPLRIAAQQGLVMFALLWFYLFMIFEVFGK